MDTQEPITRRMSRVIPLAMMLCVALGLSYEVIVASSGSGNLSFRVVIFVPFILVFAAGAVGIWRRGRRGYTSGAVASIVFVLLGLPYDFPIFADPGDPLFLADWTGNVALIIAASYIMLDHGSLWKSRA